MSFFGGHYFAPEEHMAAAHAAQSASANGLPDTAGAAAGGGAMMHRDLLMQERMAEQAQQAMALQGMAQMAQLHMQANTGKPGGGKGKQAPAGPQEQQGLQAPGFFGQTSPLVEQRIREQMALQGLVEHIHRSLHPQGPGQMGPSPMSPAPGDPYMNTPPDPMGGGYGGY